MISRKIKLCLFMLIGLVCFQPALDGFTEEAELQEKYGYSLIDVPTDAKQTYYDSQKESWEDSIYSERLLFLQRWELDVQKEVSRKERLQSELERQKSEEERKVTEKQRGKQRKLSEEQRKEQLQAREKEREKQRLEKKHKSVFKKMTDLRRKQEQRTRQEE